MEQDFSFLLTHFAQNYTAFHTRHFCELTYAMLYACWYKDLLGDFTDLDLPFLAVAASLHDIGKSALAPAIVESKEPLSPMERKVIQAHTSLGALMLGSIDLPLFQESRVCRFGYEICLHHHERWDGGGYPDGLKGDQIPPYVQAVSLADAYDALRVARSYRPALPHQEAVKLIQSGGCGAFSPKMLDRFCSIIDNVNEELYVEKDTSR